MKVLCIKSLDINGKSILTEGKTYTGQIIATNTFLPEQSSWGPYVIVVYDDLGRWTPHSPDRYFKPVE